LATVFGIVQQSGGYIDVESAPEAGSCFSIYFHLARADIDGNPNLGADPGMALRGNETILLVEDDEHVRVATKRFLRMHGYRVIEAADGAQGMRAWREVADTGHGVDLVVTDVRMPGMRGPDMVRQLVGLEPQTPVLYISGYTDDLSSVNGSHPRVALLEKPFTAEAFVQKIRQLLDARAV